MYTTLYKFTIFFINAQFKTEKKLIEVVLIIYLQIMCVYNTYIYYIPYEYLNAGNDLAIFKI